MITLYIQSQRFFFGEKQGWGCEGWAAEARAITATSRLIHDQTILERKLRMEHHTTSIIQCTSTSIRAVAQYDTTITIELK